MDRGRHTTARLAAATTLAALSFTSCTSAEPLPHALVPRIVPTRGESPTSSIVAFHGRLFGVRSSNFTGPSILVTSRDGISWRSQSIPGVPETTFAQLGELQRRGGVLALVGRVDSPTPFGDTTTPNSALYAWTTRDGSTWRGGLAATRPGTSASYSTTVSMINDTPVLGTTTTDGSFTVVRQGRDGAWTASHVSGLKVGSTDSGVGESAQLESVWNEGRYWTGRVSFAGETTRPDGGLIRGTGAIGPWSYTACDPAAECAPALTGAGLTFRGHEVSTDNGRHWKRWRITPTPAREVEQVSFVSVLRVGNAWIATATAAPPTDRSYGFLLRSVDGQHWRSLIADPCPKRGNGRPNSNFSPPVTLGDRLWTLYTCSQLGTPDLARLLVGRRDGSEWRIATDLGDRSVGVGVAAANGTLFIPLPDAHSFDGRPAQVAIVRP